MKNIFLLPAIIILTACSHQAVLNSNQLKQSENIRFQANRLDLIKHCYAHSTNKQSCELLHMQLQVEQGFTVKVNLDELPATPEKLATNLLLDAGKVYLGTKLLTNIADKVSTPTIIETPPAEVIRVDPVIITR